MIVLAYLPSFMFGTLAFPLSCWCSVISAAQEIILSLLLTMLLAAHVLLSVILLGFVECSRVKRIVGGTKSALPPEDDPLVFIYKDGHDARIFGKREKVGDFYAFKGIKYAEAPVGRFRFQRARRLRLDGDIDATTSGQPCPQPWRGEIIGAEDCLSLNVYTPALPDGGDDGYPVLVWIHGGGFRRGSASQYGPRRLVEKKLVVVTIQYRLGSLGFFSTGKKRLPGNVGLFDMSLALDWVKEYISYFGGNATKVTVSGQDTGASSALLLSMSKLTQGFLGGVIAMSGSSLSSFAIDPTPAKTSNDLALQNSCPTTDEKEMVRCLQELPFQRIIAADSREQNIRVSTLGIVGGLATRLTACPVVDGEDDRRFLPNFVVKSPLDLLNKGFFPSIPLLTGVTKDETSTAIFGKLKNDLESRIKSIPTFLESVVKDLVISSATAIANRSINAVTKITSSYLQIFTKLGGSSNKVDEAMKKIAEVTTDALFNLPAFQTAQLWSNRAPAYFYSFDHQGKKKAGPIFLEESPLTQTSADSAQNTGVGHGDDLLYVFDAQSMNGSSYENENIEDLIDARVRDTTTTMIAEFTRNGAPKMPSSGTWPAFKQGNSDYVSISSEPTTNSNFRSCQMALWSGVTDQLQSLACQTLTGVIGATDGVSGQILRPLDGILGGKSQPATNRNNASKPQRSGLGLGLGSLTG